MFELTPEQVREHHLPCLREYPAQHDLMAKDTALVSSPGLAGAKTLFPDLPEAA